MLFNVLNGTIDLNTQTLKDHSNTDLLTGRPFVSSLPLSLGDTHELTDGIGGQPAK